MISSWCQICTKWKQTNHHSNIFEGERVCLCIDISLSKYAGYGHTEPHNAYVSTEIVQWGCHKRQFNSVKDVRNTSFWENWNLM